jgi:hypothetical protein
VKEKEDLILFSIKALAVATAVSAGVVFAMPVASQAMPQTAPVKVDTAKNSHIVDVRHRTRRWARYCRYHMGDYRCNHGRVYSRYYRYRYYDDPYYYPYRPYYGYYRPYYRPGIGLGPLRFGF